ncbi:MAG TPA: autotransporter outer membrane beta-barrel domain-containing protein [Bacteroidia bacterium]|nr:autotransporter outer membrane beta-barrel domain-containing protein [Bacteroidia bacterium]
MRAPLIILLFLANFSTNLAQNVDTTSNKRRYIGLNLSGNYLFQSINSTDDSKLNLNTSPFIGFKKKNFVLGAGIIYGFSQEATNVYFGNNFANVNATTTVHNLGIYPIVRYYSRYGLFFSSALMYGIGREITKYPNFTSRTATTITNKSESNFLIANFSLGYAIKAGKSFLVEPQISYSYFDRSYNNSANLLYVRNSVSYFQLNLGFGLIYRY